MHLALDIFCYLDPWAPQFFGFFSEISLKYWSIRVSETGPGLVYSLGQIFELRLLTIVVIKVDMSER